MKRFSHILIYLCLLIYSNSFGQTSFSILDSNSFGLGKIEETNFGYLAGGAVFNISGTGSVTLSKYDQNGQNVQTDTFTSDGVISTSPILVKIDENHFLFSNMINNILPYQAANNDVMYSNMNMNLDSIWSLWTGGNLEELPADILAWQDFYWWLSTTQSFGAGASDVYLTKTDTLGNILWEKTFGTVQPEVGINISPTNDGGLIVSGLRRHVLPDWNILLFKLDTAGNMLWEVDYGIPENDYGAFLTPLHDHTFLVFHNSNDGMGGTTTGYIDKVDGNGELIWQKTYPYLNFSSFSWGKPIENEDGSIMLNCAVKNGQGTVINRLLKITPFGDTLWTKTYFTRDDLPNYIYDIKPTSDSGYIMAGSAFPVDTNIQRAWLIKTDCNGADGVMYPTGAPCVQYDCSQYPIDAFFTPSETTIDLAQGGQVTFTNSSTNATSRVWNFGDGVWDYTDSVITHTFTDTGWFNVSLIVFHGVCSDTMVVPIHVINTVGIDAYAQIGHGLKVFPNPSNGVFNLKFEHPAKGVCVVVNLLGKIQAQFSIDANEKMYKIEGLDKGVYMCYVKYEHGGNEVVKLIVE